MDRRDALKKLGVGGAVAVAAPVLLDSFNVANASSLTLPEATEVKNTTSVVADGTTGAVTITLDTSGPPYTFPTDTQFSWGAPTPNNLKIEGSALSPVVVIDDAANKDGALPQFSIVLTATDPGGNPGSKTYTFTVFVGALDFSVA